MDGTPGVPGTINSPAGRVGGKRPSPVALGASAVSAAPSPALNAGSTEVSGESVPVVALLSSPPFLSYFKSFFTANYS